MLFLCDDRVGRLLSDVFGLIEYLKAEFCDVAVRQMQKGENVGWYIDQRLISFLVSDWIRQHGVAKVKLVPRSTNSDRSVLLSVFCYV